MEKREILKEGRNCWRMVSSDRATFLVDGESYYSAFAEAMEHARQQVLIVSWDIDSRIRQLFESLRSFRAQKLTDRTDLARRGESSP